VVGRSIEIPTCAAGLVARESRATTAYSRQD
jgi:hypothetical protein